MGTSTLHVGCMKWEKNVYVFLVSWLVDWFMVFDGPDVVPMDQRPNSMLLIYSDIAYFAVYLLFEKCSKTIVIYLYDNISSFVINNSVASTLNTIINNSKPVQLQCHYFSSNIRWNFNEK